MVPLGQQAKPLRVPDRDHLTQAIETQRRDRDRSGVVGVVLVRPPVANSRVLDANVAGTSSTVSPAATSC